MAKKINVKLILELRAAHIEYSDAAKPPIRGNGNHLSGGWKPKPL